ncbi:MAG TPA: prepilin-type N-terminal cleavage/methylation domain-containing protein [Gemmatimonadaceae bacterium]|nr:prepilin-type N-terminal cleavage/methylation domain-containing protein [Gemmatimonadaceae bacterium]
MRQHRRSGFTLIELLIVLTLLAIVGGSLMSMVSKQQRFYQGTYDLIELRSQLRQAEAVVSSDLRSMSTPGGDIVSMTDSSMDFRYTIGSSISCTTPAGSTIIIPPTASANGNTLTNWLTKPAAGDTAFVFDEMGSAASSGDDEWKAYEITTLTTGAANCAGAYNAPSAGYALVATGSISPTILQGAPIRFVRRAHYSLYQSGNDGNWYLGYSCSSCGTTTVQPIAGPFKAYTDAGGTDTSGIRITYFDSTGATTTATNQVSRISIVLRGQTRSALNVSGLKRGVYMDSIRMNIALRNRS